MKKIKCVYYQTNSGRMPAKEFVDSLDERSQQKYFEVVDLLRGYGKSLPEPHAKFLEDGIHELRFFGIEGRVRILYFFFHGDKAVLTHGLVKKKGPVPKKDIKTAKGRMITYLEKHIKS